jgi:hypothetical protein
VCNLFYIVTPVTKILISFKSSDTRQGGALVSFPYDVIRRTQKKCITMINITVNDCLVLLIIAQFRVLYSNFGVILVIDDLTNF